MHKMHGVAAAFAVTTLFSALTPVSASASRATLAQELEFVKALRPGQDFVIYDNGEMRRYCEKFTGYKILKNGYIEITIADRWITWYRTIELIGDPDDHLIAGCPKGGIPI
jgi:hypothetical protein